MNGTPLAPSREEILGRQPLPQDFFYAAFTVGDARLEVRAADAELDAALRLVFGPPSPGPAALNLRVSVTPDTVIFDDPLASSVGADDLLLGLDTPDLPFRLTGPGSFAWRDDDEPLFQFEGGVCRYRRREGWPLAVALLLLHRVYAIHRHAIFFHAATVDAGGRGLMIVGRKGCGKSTTSMALTARGHALLGDETACYVPKTNELLPFRRPVGIKPGPRSRAIQSALDARGLDTPDVLRIDFDELLPTATPHRVPLHAILFLQPFRSEPLLTERPATRDDLGRLQPVTSSFVNAPRTQRVFELTRMLSGARIFDLHPADPDETAQLIERHFTGESG